MYSRTCRGNVECVIFLNSREYKALVRLLDAYIVTETGDPRLPQLKRILSGIENVGVENRTKR